MAAKPTPPPIDFAAKYVELDGNKEHLKAFYRVGRVVLDRWIDEVIDQGKDNARVIELADLPSGRPAEMIEERGMDPALWCVASLTVNEWEVTSTDEDGEPATSLNRQTKLTAVPTREEIRAARTDGWKPPAPKPRKPGKTEVDLICGDMQAPYHDEALHKALLNWLAEVKPRRIVDDGDLPDFPSVSKYPKKAGWNASVNSCIDSSYRIWCDRRSASPDSVCVQMEGNHCKRLADKMARDFEEVAMIRRAGEDTPALALPHLLRLDELGIEFIGDYPHGIYKLADDVAVIHGDKVKQGSGATGLATLMQRGYNVFLGHIHRQSITEHTWHDIDNNPFTKYAIEVGAGCIVKGGLAHTVNADWQNGFATATFHPDGTFQPELMNWQNGKLLWRGDWWK